MSEPDRPPNAETSVREVRPYLIVDDGSLAIEFYRRAFDARELERHNTPRGRVGHAKIQVGQTILEMGEHPDAAARAIERVPRVGLRLYVADVDQTYARAVAAGGVGEAPTDRPQQGVRGATVVDPFGLTWWLAGPLR